MITVEHIRFARVNQLASLLEVTVPHASAILAGKYGISERVLERGATKGIRKDILMMGLDAKRADLQNARLLQHQLDTALLNGGSVIENV